MQFTFQFCSKWEGMPWSRLKMDETRGNWRKVNEKGFCETFPTPYRANIKCIYTELLYYHKCLSKKNWIIFPLWGFWTEMKRILIIWKGYAKCISHLHFVHLNLYARSNVLHIHHSLIEQRSQKRKTEFILNLSNLIYFLHLWDELYSEYINQISVL